eukprot:CAMPEP_0172497588 /NCGR_PEP_ID=MMETSP1066-20121228/101884_1 /TAXON_ID=671091 /ORGANISM="Coscinodiscus wailesii, Strain CCMP2513" /LENGTH=378 /DNA_ID=CAMNT_0013270447 /DNA_START=55 /DNA_END=1187 /DNA_ORIENTATION=-
MSSSKVISKTPSSSDAPPQTSFPLGTPENAKTNDDYIQPPENTTPPLLTDDTTIADNNPHTTTAATAAITFHPGLRNTHPVDNDTPLTASENLHVSEFKSSALRPFVIISSSYLLFTITDGAIRMIVLLHAYNKGFSAMQVAIMFTLYELAGAFTNLAAGMMGARWGIKLTLICGLTLQLLSYGLLFGWRDDWTQRQAMVYVTIAQMFAGIAKDLTKLGGKTVTKLVTPEEQNTKLFRLVSLITGLKNSLKGVGYFLGSILIQVNYNLALGFMMGLVVLAMPWAVMGLDNNLGTAKKKNATWREIFVMDNFNLNVLSLARFFLFASRDFWFEVPLPFYLRSPDCAGLGDVCGGGDDVVADCPVGAICGEGVCSNFNLG